MFEIMILNLLGGMAHASNPNFLEGRNKKTRKNKAADVSNLARPCIFKTNKKIRTTSLDVSYHHVL